MITGQQNQREIRKGVVMGKEAFKKRNELLRGKLDLQLKKRMAKSLTWSVTLYASETWTMREDVKRLETFDMWIWERLKISWKEHITNEEVLHMVHERRTLINTIHMTKEMDRT